MQAFAPAGLEAIGAMLLLLAITILCLRAVAHELSLASRHHAAERDRADANITLDAPQIGMFKATTLAAAAFCCLTAPMLAGALHDRHRRQEALAFDIRELRQATITLAETPARFGARSEVIARRDGVLIRHINIQDLVALVYGIGAVRSVRRRDALDVLAAL